MSVSWTVPMLPAELPHQGQGLRQGKYSIIAPNVFPNTRTHEFCGKDWL